jgi:hypothetical protein
VYTAHNDGNTSATKSSGNFVRAGRFARHRRQSDDIASFLEVNRFYHFIDDFYVMLRERKTGESRNGQGQTKVDLGKRFDAKTGGIKPTFKLIFTNASVYISRT